MWRAGVLLIATMVGETATASEVMYHDNLVPTVYSGDAWRAHRPVDFSIRYDTKAGELAFYATFEAAAFGFAMNREQADSLISIIDKYKRWNLKASAMDIELDKKIAPLPVSRTYWSLGEVRMRADDADLDVYFLSQSEEKHLLVITFPTLVSPADRRVTARPESLYFDWTNALELRRALGRDVLKRFLEKPRTPHEIAEQFK